MYTPVFLGQGAIASLLAAQCQQQGIDYRVLGRHPKLSSIRWQQGKQQLAFTPESIDKHQLTAKHLLVLPIKAYQVQDALSQLSAYLQQVPILLFHNGMGTIETSRRLLPQNPILAATTSYAALKSQHNQLIQTGVGDTNIGWVQHPASALQQWLMQTLSQLLPPVIWQQNIETALWQKLAINAVINPITAIEQIKNGRISEDKYQPLISQLCREIAQIMQKKGFETTSEILKHRVLSVSKATADNYSSMNRDIFYGRKTEVEFINGYIQQQAQELGLRVNTNWQMLEKIRQLEQFGPSQ